MLRLKNPAWNYSSGLCNKEPPPLCQGTAGEVFWQCQEEQMLLSAHCSAAHRHVGPLHLPPFPRQHEGNNAVEGHWRFWGEGPCICVVRVQAVTLQRSPSHRQALWACSLTACTWQGHSPPNLVRAAVQEGIASKAHWESHQKTTPRVNEVSSSVEWCRPLAHSRCQQTGVCSEEGKHRDFLVEFMTDEEQCNKHYFSVCEDCYGKEGPSLFSMGPRERGRIKEWKVREHVF